MSSEQDVCVSSGLDGADGEDIASPRVGLFVTCLVDLFRPSIGFAAVKLLEKVGCTVEVPMTQTCCGQPAFNSGARYQAQSIARHVLDAFDDFDYVVAPSGSCAGMLRCHYPTLLAEDLEWGPRAVDLARRTHELVSFLVDVRGMASASATFEGTVVYQDSCGSLRDMGVRDQPRDLLKTVSGLTLQEAPESDSCCGFGGTFSVKYGPISSDIVGRKVDALTSVNPNLILGGDLGCLMNIAGKLRRHGLDTHVRHVAELLADMVQDAPIGAPNQGEI